MSSSDEVDDKQLAHQHVAQGPVMPIGGAEEKNGDGNDDILIRFFELAGGEKARIVVIPTASEEPEEIAKDYTEAFTKLGATSVELLNVSEREDANSAGSEDLIVNSTGIFITGGDQSRLVELLVGTTTMELIRRCNREGTVVAGTSAGASILASHMMLGGTGLAGDSGDAAARKNMVEMVAGFGLLEDVIVDQHFSERGRMGRLLSVFAANPGLLSIGLDEDTAVLINDGILEVIGSGMVTIIDGRDAKSDFFDRDVGEVLTVADSHLSVLGPGRKLDLQTRKALMDEDDRARVPTSSSTDRT